MESAGNNILHRRLFQGQSSLLTARANLGSLLQQQQKSSQLDVDNGVTQQDNRFDDAIEESDNKERYQELQQRQNDGRILEDNPDENELLL